MSKKRTQEKSKKLSAPVQTPSGKSFHLEFLNPAQKLAWATFDKHDVLFLLGAAGAGKSHLASAFAISEILAKKKSKIIMTRPIVEAGEKLGFLPGSFSEKCDPYMHPLYDCIDRCLGGSITQKEHIMKHAEVSPLAFMRGKTFHDSICILDEAQNCTKMQLKLFLTRFGKNSKIIITGDPQQSDLPGPCALVDVVKRLEGVPGIGVITFQNNSIVRHPLIASILEKLE